MPYANGDVSSINTNYLSRIGLSRKHPPILDDYASNQDLVTEPVSEMYTNVYGIHCMNAPYMNGNLYADISSVVLENNTIMGLPLTGNVNNNPLKSHGAYVGNLINASNNNISNVNLGLHCHLNITGKMQITANSFYNNEVGIQLTKMIYLDPAITPSLLLGCNTFDFDRSLTPINRVGILIEKGAKVGTIKGLPKPSDPNTNFRSANVWPVASGTNRAEIPTNPNTGIQVNVEHITYGFNSPPQWTSIVNNTTQNLDPAEPQVRHPLTYQRYTNEFVGNISPNSNLLINIQAPTNSKLAFTINANGSLSGSQYEEVCNSILTGSTIVLPTSYAQNGNDPKPESGITISQVLENRTITISLPENDSEYTLIITDLLGRKIESKEGKSNKETTLNFNFPYKGIYLVSYETQGQIQTSKIIVK